MVCEVCVSACVSMCLYVSITYHAYHVCLWCVRCVSLRWAHVSLPREALTDARVGFLPPSLPPSLPCSFSLSLSLSLSLSRSLSLGLSLSVSLSRSLSLCVRARVCMYVYTHMHTHRSIALDLTDAKNIALEDALRAYFAEEKVRLV